ncbi:MAG TPA: aldehyde dehydrogenase family protein [Tepidisphaeraceae bacterium]|jgi:NADP-dependent aldehyde dehydrogenase
MSVTALPTVSPANPPAVHPVLIAGQWRASQAAGTFRAINPRTREALPDEYPVSAWPDLDAALAAAAQAALVLRTLPDVADRVAGFLESYAKGIERNVDRLAASAVAETALAVSPRLKDVELPRTMNQLRGAAASVRAGSWQRPTIDTKAGLRSCLGPIGPVWTIGPNNFPFAYNGVAGGDFASAIAAGNPVIAKAHPLHPTTSRLLAEIAHTASNASGLPIGSVQFLYHMNPDDGLRLIADPRLKAVGFTGSRSGGLKLKAAADAAGKLFFGEMSSVNPVVLLPGALAENADAIAGQFLTSLLTGTGQFCTKPGIVVLLAGADAEAFIDQVCVKATAAPPGLLFSEGGRTALTTAIHTLQQAGAQLVAGGGVFESGGFSVQNTLLRVSADGFLRDSATFQTEAFGSASLFVVADDLDQTRAVLESFEGNLTGSIYSAMSGADDAAYAVLAPILRARVGRLLNDKMPTGVAVSGAMNHGGPYPATSQPHFTAVGFPAAIFRFTQLESYDNVRPQRLPPCLQDKNPTGTMWRLIDGDWTRADVGAVL